MTEVSFKRISSRDNALFKRIARLASSARERREQGATLLDGPHLLASYRDAGGVAEAVVASESAHARAEIRRLFESAPARARVLVSDRLFAEIAQVVEPVGLLAVIGTPGPPAPPARAETCLLLDGIQDPGNLGSMLRTAAAAGARHVFLSKGCVFAWSPKVLRAGQGAHFFLAIHERATLTEVAAGHRGTVATTDVQSGIAVFEADLRGPVAWIFGSEGSGVSRELAGAASLRVRIPMPGRLESLNVAAAAAICLFEQVRQQRRS
ncbi:MAG TPA: RNA methyltransferase [Burkholderiales bacterium]|nr:RNA methyltransferase [Burkholderiales bacterium]